jgi:hypothetical protein
LKAEVPSDAEAAKDPLAITHPGIKAEPEVSCLYVHVTPISLIQVSIDLRTVATEKILH